MDWHNFGYSILGLTHGPGSRLVCLARRIELWLGRCGHIHLTVTEAMRTWLVETAGYPSEAVHVLHDRPTHRFKHLTLEAKHEVQSPKNCFHGWA